MRRCAVIGIGLGDLVRAPVVLDEDARLDARGEAGVQEAVLVRGEVEVLLDRLAARAGAVLEGEDGTLGLV